MVISITLPSFSVGSLSLSTPLSLMYMLVSVGFRLEGAKVTSDGRTGLAAEISIIQSSAPSMVTTATMVLGPCPQM